MTEIEKARLALAHDLDEAAKSGSLVDYSLVSASVEILVRAVITEYADRGRAREEIAAHEAILLHEAMHGEIEKVVRWFGETISRHEDTTALARRLAEALRNQHESAYPDQAMTEQALTEARKAGLIE